ncbi:hypothetical protein Bhyg_05256 [Pseudolycoriella hygida]|uniref:Uncharacterized protein n=1 Tax=Pseudolycoriella hygida TaxID=35572 RepID=A0A9Q0NGW8_9DIPT|nr:hypothetical protein Bhyg_05256 [Pseudolycoriella hygida]
MDIYETKDCVTESSDCSSSQPYKYRQNENTSRTKGTYKCEVCGHMNEIVTSVEDGFLDNSQAIDNSQTTSVFQVSIDPGSLELKSNPFPSNFNQLKNPAQDGKIKSKKRISYPGDVGEYDELEQQTAQKYIAVLRKTVMDQRKQTINLMQQNRRKQQRINKLKTLLKELVEKTKNGNYVIEP